MLNLDASHGKIALQPLYGKFVGTQTGARHELDSVRHELDSRKMHKTYLPLWRPNGPWFVPPP